MTVEEVKNSVEELKAQGLSEEEIAASFYQMFKEDKIDLEQFEALANVIGYELSDEFKAMSDEEKKNQDVGEFGMSEDDDEDEDQNDDENNEDNSNEEPSNDDNDNQNDEDEEEENPFEKDYSKKKSDDEDEEEFKKTYGF